MQGKFSMGIKTVQFVICSRLFKLSNFESSLNWFSTQRKTTQV